MKLMILGSFNIVVHKSKVEEKKSEMERRSGKLKVRSISDSAEESSHHRQYISRSHNQLHGHSLDNFYKDGGKHFGPVEYEQSQKMQFQIHGQEGPESYRFGHDTGSG